jgi:DNA-binding NarL/FixJ family response regulator
MPSDPSSITVAVIDDHDAIHAGVEAWCRAAAPPIDVVGRYTAVDTFFTDHPSATGLDVVLLDLELRSRQPDFTAVQRISDAGHQVVVYSHIVHEEVILRCLDLGAGTYVAKAEGKHHLLEAIRAAGNGTMYVGPRMAGAMSNDNRSSRPGLTAREQEVLVAWFQTENKDLVARRLGIAPSSVRTYLQRVRAKYAAVGRPAATKAALVARAVQDGVVSVDDL